MELLAFDPASTVQTGFSNLTAPAWEMHKAHPDTSSRGRTLEGWATADAVLGHQGPGGCISEIKEDLTGSIPGDSWRLHRRGWGGTCWWMRTGWKGTQDRTQEVSLVEGVHRCGGAGEGSQALLWSALVRGLSCDKCGSPCRALGWEGRLEGEGMVASRETGAGKPESDCRLQRAMYVHTEP